MKNDINRRQFVEAAAAAAAAAVPMLSARAMVARTVARIDPAARASDLDHDLLEVTIERLHTFYDARKYTATQVTRWYLDRIAKYNPIYRPLVHVDGAGALATARALDAAPPSRGKRPPLWGVPIVIKANTSVKGLVTSTGWYGYVIPGLELVAPEDATVVKKLRAAGAIILGQTSLPDFAASDTNYSTAYGRTGNAYNVRCSPGGSSGGTVTAVAANLCVFGTGSDTGNSIRMPSSTSSVVGVLPTKGLVSITGIHPLDWLRDNTGPIARTVSDAAIALAVMQGEDARDFRTKDAPADAQRGPYVAGLSARALEGKRFGVPAFIVEESPRGTPLAPETRALFASALEGMQRAGATVVVDDAILPDAFYSLTGTINTHPYTADGLESFLKDFGPPAYHSTAEYARATGAPLPPFIRGAGGNGPLGQQASASDQRRLADDPQAEATFWGPQRAALAQYADTLKTHGLDGYVYPAAQIPPNDEIAVLDSGGRSSGPHSRTAWVNPIGTPAVVVPGGFYDNGLPFGLEIATTRWRDGDLLGWAFAYEQATKHRKPPVLVSER